MSEASRCVAFTGTEEGLSPSDLAAIAPRAATFADVEATASLLVKHGRRQDAVALVGEVLEQLDDLRTPLLLARLHLESGTREGAEEAAALLGFLRCGRSLDPEAAVLLRRALTELGRAREVAKLDRELRWSPMPETSARRVQS